MPHLWIDSLCIIQDSTDDRQHEEALMSDVYTNSWCNIAATNALDARDGCFVERTLLDISQCIIEAKWNSHSSQFTYAGSQTYGIRQTTTISAATGMGDTGIVLSPRVLNFSEHQMFWECLELRACEMFPPGIPRNTIAKLNPCTYSLRHIYLKYEDPMRQRLGLWGPYLQEYSRGHLTLPEKDKLVTILGLTRRLGSGEEYCAGLWRQDLAGQLTWSVAKDKRPSAKTPERDPRAPSWSWASGYSPVCEGIFLWGLI